MILRNTKVKNSLKILKMIFIKKIGIKSIYYINVEPIETNFSTLDGIIGVDCNLDHYALTNVSKDGNLLNSKVIKFDFKKMGKNKN